MFDIVGSVRACPSKIVYNFKENDGPICVSFRVSNLASPACKAEDACKSLEGDTVLGSEADKLAPLVVSARLINGTASSIRASRDFMSSTILFAPSLSPSTGAVSSFIRLPKSLMSFLRDTVSCTVLSSVVFPRAAIISMRSIAGVTIYVSRYLRFSTLIFWSSLFEMSSSSVLCEFFGTFCIYCDTCLMA